MRRRKSGAPRTECLIAVGSNSGDSRARALKAFRSLASLPETRLVARSPLYASQAVGGRTKRPFVNAAALVETRLSPAGLLLLLKRLEALAGRRPGRRWGARPLDLDVILYGRRKIRTNILRIPHPRAFSRDFVLLPAADLLPGTRPPGRRKTLGALAAARRSGSCNAKIIK